MDDTKMNRVTEILKRLKRLYPEPIVELDYTTPFELMVASLMAAQNRDTVINRMTPAVFRKYRGPAEYVAVDPSELEQDIIKSGFFRQKTKAIRALSQKLLDDYGGKVPETMDELLTLPGIGRKTANVILSFAMGKAEGIVVDTHHLRVNARLGLSSQKLADKMEKEMVEIVPEKDWIIWSSSITLHGRRVCVAKKPKCSECVLGPDLCPSYKNLPNFA
ncbi:MAG: endonuclease III [Acidobacteriota bacterium]|nr:endonuclease III [Acidobacteriota bacterium]